MRSRRPWSHDLGTPLTTTNPRDMHPRTHLKARRSRRLIPRVDDELEPRALLSSLAMGASVSAFVVSHDSTWTKMANIVYPTVAGPSQRLDVYTPLGPAPAGGWPVLVAIHGGGWRRFDKAGYGERVARGFVPRGFVVVAPNYVLSAHDRPTWPINLEDVQAAVVWTRQNAPSLGVNPRRVVAIGESAGANLATLLGVTPTLAGSTVSPQVNAVIAFSAPTDLPALYAQSPLAGLAVKQFLGGTPRQVPASYVAASPIDHVASGDPPMFLVHGIEDPLVPDAQSQAMSTALAAAGVPHRLVLVPGGHMLDFPARYSELIPQILEFLNATWNS